MKIILSFLLAFFVTGLFAQDIKTDPVQLDLQKSITLALEYNHDLKLARFEQMKADEQVNEAWGSSVFPKISGFADYSRALKKGVIIIDAPELGFSGSFPQGTDNTMTIGATLEQPLFTGAIFLAVRVAKTYAEIQEKFVEATQDEVIVNVNRAYYSVLLAEEVVDLEKMNLGLAEDNLKNTEAMFKAGVVPEYDYIRAKVQYQNLIPELQQAENSYVLSKNLLKLVTGLDLETEIIVSDSLDLEEIPLTNQEEYDELLLSRNPALKQLELNMSLTDDNISYQFTKHFPELYFVGNWQMQAQENDPRPFNNWRYNNAVFIGFNLRVPIFDGLQTTSKVEQARIEFYKAQEQYQKTASQLKNNLEDVLLSIDQTKKQLESYRATIEQAELAYDISQKRYASGVGTQLETIDAMVSLTRAQVNYFNSIYEYYILYAQLDQLLAKKSEYQNQN
ncbi:MAG TPA: TolC family protein [Ignavibacteriaceae bacterium]|nr:TolC family protein [Ignavibacteriaceae bacterium]